MELLEEIRDGALSDSTSLTEVLRRCVVLGYRMKYPPLTDWANQELNGYASQEMVPSYRILTAQLTGNFSTAGWRHDSHPVPMSIFPDDSISDVVTVPILQDVASLQKWEAKELITLKPRHSNLEEYVTSNIGDGWFCSLVWLQVAPSRITGLLSQIRNRIVGFVLDIEVELGDKALPDGSVATRSRERVNYIFETNFYGNSSNVVTGLGSIITPQISIELHVEAGNTHSLRNFLTRQGIDNESIARLERLLEQDPKGETLQNEDVGIGQWVKQQSGQANQAVGEIAKQAATESLKTGLVLAIREYAPLVAHAAQRLIT